MTEPTYTLDEVYEEAKEFAKAHNIPIASKKGLPKGNCAHKSSCVLANLFGGAVSLDYKRSDNDMTRYGVSLNGYVIDRIPFDSDILDTFVSEFDEMRYPELIS